MQLTAFWSPTAYPICLWFWREYQMSFKSWKLLCVNVNYFLRVVTLCSLWGGCHRFRGTYLLHLQASDKKTKTGKWTAVITSILICVFFKLILQIYYPVKAFIERKLDIFRGQNTILEGGEVEFSCADDFRKLCSLYVVLGEMYCVMSLYHCPDITL
jgi:hypothetical protein